MAFCLIVEKMKVDWLQVSSEIIMYKIPGINFFPLQTDDINAIGITINRMQVNNNDLSGVLKKLIPILIKEGFSIFELYSGKEITKKNIKYLLNIIG